MARPLKPGMDYFPHDTDASADEKIEAMRFLYGNDGYAFYFILLERIYRTDKAELDISDAETIQILSKKLGINSEQFDKMLKTALKHGLFDPLKYTNGHVLTSSGIKHRAGYVIQKREYMRQKYARIRVSGAETTTETRQQPDKQNKTKQNKTKAKIPPTPLKGVQQQYFQQFWLAYPNKVGKLEAREAFIKINPDADLLSKILASIGRSIQTELWLKEGGKFILDPARWLRKRRWEDEGITLPDINEVKPYTGL